MLRGKPVTGLPGITPSASGPGARWSARSAANPECSARRRRSTGRTASCSARPAPAAPAAAVSAAAAAPAVLLLLLLGRRRAPHDRFLRLRFRSLGLCFNHGRRRLGRRLIALHHFGRNALRHAGHAAFENGPTLADQRLLRRAHDVELGQLVERIEGLAARKRDARGQRGDGEKTVAHHVLALVPVSVISTSMR